MVKIRLSLLALAVIVGASPLSKLTAADDPQLNQILQHHLDAMGGLRNWQQIESIRLNGTIERDGQSVDICIVKKRPDLIRATVTIPLPNDPEQHVKVIRAFDGKTAWTATRLPEALNFEKQILDDEAAADLLIDAGVLPALIKLWRSGDAELHLAETVDSPTETLYVIEANLPKTENTFRFYVSAETHLIVSRESLSADGSTISHISEFAEIEGITIPRLHRIESPATGLSIMQTESIEIGVGIYDDYFATATD